MNTTENNNQDYSKGELIIVKSESTLHKGYELKLSFKQEPENEVTVINYSGIKVNAEANAKRIVTAVNNHDKLVELLAWAEKVINASVPKQAGYGAIEILPQIKEALEKVK